MEVVHERVPLLAGDEQLAVRVDHRAPRVRLRPARRPAHHLGDVVLESLGRDAVVRLVDSRVRIQPRVDHDSVDEVVYDDGDRVGTPEPLVQGLCFLGLHLASLAFGRIGAPNLPVSRRPPCAFRNLP